MKIIKKLLTDKTGWKATGATLGAGAFIWSVIYHPAVAATILLSSLVVLMWVVFYWAFNSKK